MTSHAWKKRDLRSDLQWVLDGPDTVWTSELRTVAVDALHRAIAAEGMVNMLEVLVAWAEGELSECQVVRLLGMDHVDVRGARLDAIANALSLWARYRDSNPPSPSSEPSTSPV